MHAPLKQAAKPRERESCACGGVCPKCREQYAARPKPAASQPGDMLESSGRVNAPAPAMPRFLQKYPLRADLEVSQPRDASEQEADRIAEQVMRMPQPGRRDVSDIHHDSGIQVSRYSAGAPPQSGPGLPAVVHEAVRSPGEPLDPAIRSSMEGRFGRDFSAVRVHADHRAGQSAVAVNALAYTIGSDIVFAPGWDRGATEPGRRLIAHELVHVLQQEGSAGTGSPLFLQRQPAPAPEPAPTPEPTPSACAGWEEDLVSLVTAVARHYAQTALTPPRPGAIRKVQFSGDRRIATAHFHNGLELFVSLYFLPDHIPVVTHGWSNVSGPRCLFTYSCPPDGTIVFATKSCTGTGGQPAP